MFGRAAAGLASDASALWTEIGGHKGTLDKVVAAGGEVVKPIFSFPGGRRFHFTEPSGNEFAVWSEPEA